MVGKHHIYVSLQEANVRWCYFDISRGNHGIPNWAWEFLSQTWAAFKARHYIDCGKMFIGNPSSSMTLPKKSPTITNQEKSLITYQTAFPVCFIVFFHLYMTWISASVLAVSLDAFVIWKKVALDAARLALDHLRSGPVKNITVTFHRTLTMKNDDFMGVNFF